MWRVVEYRLVCSLGLSQFMRAVVSPSTAHRRTRVRGRTVWTTALLQYEADVRNSGTDCKGSSQISRCQNVLDPLQMMRWFTRNGT
jgi:hypothetical protein